MERQDKLITFILLCNFESCSEDNFKFVQNFIQCKHYRKMYCFPNTTLKNNINFVSVHISVSVFLFWIPTSVGSQWWIRFSLLSCSLLCTWEGSWVNSDFYYNKICVIIKLPAIKSFDCRICNMNLDFFVTKQHKICQ
jgi:hypothetical protein